MTYLYGDSTPFPLEDNFVETLGDVIDACVAILKVDEEVDAAAARADAARNAALKEHGHLEAIASSVVRSLEPHIGESHAGGQIAVRTMQAARGVLETARTDVAVRRDATLRDIASSVGTSRGAITRALETLLSRRELPKTEWRVEWKAGLGEAASHATARAKTKFKLDYEMEITIPNSHAFAHPVKIESLGRFAIRLPETGGWLRKAGRLRKEQLDKYFITEVDASPEKVTLVLRKSGKHASDGLELVVRATGGKPSARFMKPTGPAMSDPIVLTGADLDAASDLWKKVEPLLTDLRKKRTRLVSAQLGLKLAHELAHPAELAGAMIDSCADIVREMRVRSAAPTELDLKRDLGSGRREEMFVSRKSLTQKWSGLSAARQAEFDIFGLEDSASAVIDELLEEVTDISKPAMPAHLFAAKSA